MGKRIVLLLAVLVTTLAPARDKAETWLEVRSHHFTVVTNASEKTGRRIAEQFERMRLVLHAAFPYASIETGSPIIVLAIKDEQNFRALEPQSYLAKGQLRLGGLFLRAPDKNYVLIRLDADGDHPYAVVYHEYTHLVLSQAAEWLPLWLNEGMAEFYQNTDIHEKDVELGQANLENEQLLRENRLLPLATLFAVDAGSPYYHEENKGSIFYAESWALTHYLHVVDHQEKTHRLTDYEHLLAEKIDPLTAATRAFGDLAPLQSNLEGYIRQGAFVDFKLTASTSVDATAFSARALTVAQADAMRADFLAYCDRVADARTLLRQVLQRDPQNVLAHETMGFLEFHSGHLGEARKWYEQAVKLDSQSYLAHYYFAAMSINEGVGAGDDAQVEASLRAAIKLNPSFAPAYDAMAAFECMRRRKLDEAHLMALKAVELDPANVSYRVTAANVLVQMDRSNDAASVLHNALRVAKSPDEVANVQNLLTRVDQYAAAHEKEEKEEERNQTQAAEPNATNEAAAEPRPDNNAEVDAHDEELPKGTHHFLLGTLRNVHCDVRRMDLTVASRGKTMALHTSNFFGIEFTALGFRLRRDLNPCTDLDGRAAMVEYVNSAAKPPKAYVVAIELHN